MADQLATVADLASLLQTTVDAAFTATATVLIEAATAVVQVAAGGQRIIQVVDDTITLTGTTDAWLDLPQIPVTAVSAVMLDGATVPAGAVTTTTNYKRFGNRLWRGAGWATYVDAPSEVAVTNTHGYATGAQDLQLGRQAVMALAAGVYPNPEGATQVRIDDYMAAYEAMSARMEESPALKARLRKQYGRRGRLVRIG